MQIFISLVGVHFEYFIRAIICEMYLELLMDGKNSHFYVDILIEHEKFYEMVNQ